MDIRELQSFVQVADLGNYSAAAERLYISQPALSKVNKKIEDVRWSRRCSTCFSAASA